MNIREVTVEADGLKITVRQELGTDVFDEIGIERHLPPAQTNEDVRRTEFIRLVLRTTKIEGLNWWVTLNSSGEAIRAAYEKLPELKRPTLVKWSNATYEADDDKTADPALAPVQVGES